MSKNKSIVQTLLVMLLWGSLFPAVKLGYGAYGIVTTGDILFFAGVRFIICGIAICIYTAVTDRKSYKGLAKAWLPVMMSGVFSIILHYGFTYSALRLTDGSKTAILKQVGVLFYVCFSFLFFKDDRLTLRKLIGVVTGFIGIIAINSSNGQVNFNIGDWLIIAASFCTVFSNVISKKVFERVKPVTATGVSQLFGGIVLLAVGALLGGSMSFSAGSSAGIMLYICAASILSYLVWFLTVKKEKLSKLFIIKFAEPVFACMFSAFLLEENILTPQYLSGFLLISAGIWISNK